MSDLKGKRSRSWDGGGVLVMCLLGGNFADIIRLTFDHIGLSLVHIAGKVCDNWARLS